MSLLLIAAVAAAVYFIFFNGKTQTFNICETEWSTFSKTFAKPLTIVSATLHRPKDYPECKHPTPEEHKKILGVDPHAYCLGSDITKEVGLVYNGKKLISGAGQSIMFGTEDPCFGIIKILKLVVKC